MVKPEFETKKLTAKYAMFFRLSNLLKIAKFAKLCIDSALRTLFLNSVENKILVLFAVKFLSF
jgi:hypothetical protein